MSGLAFGGKYELFGAKCTVLACMLLNSKGFNKHCITKDKARDGKMEGPVLLLTVAPCTAKDLQGQQQSCIQLAADFPHIPHVNQQLVRLGLVALEQGHVRVGPETITDPAFHVTKNMEDFVTWVDTSKIKRKVAQYNDKLDDYDLMI